MYHSLKVKELQVDYDWVDIVYDKVSPFDLVDGCARKTGRDSYQLYVYIESIPVDLGLGWVVIKASTSVRIFTWR